MGNIKRMENVLPWGGQESPHQTGNFAASTRRRSQPRDQREDDIHCRENGTSRRFGVDKRCGPGMRGAIVAGTRGESERHWTGRQR